MDDVATVPRATPVIGLLSLATAYQSSFALFAAARLGLADRLSEAPRTAEEVAAETGWHAPSLLRLMRSLAALGVLQVEGKRFALAPMGRALKSATADTALGLVLMHAHPDFHSSWASLDACVRQGPLAGVPSQSRAAPTWVERYEEDAGLGAVFDRGMSGLARTLAKALLKAFDLSAVRHLVDVGGGDGTLLGEVLRACPGLHGTVYDLPRVAGQAARLLDEAGLSNRCTAIGGDMFEAVPEQGDLYLLSRILHDWEDEPASAILRNCGRAMRHATRLVLLERIVPDDGTPTEASAQFLADLHMMVRTGGRERTGAEYQALLARAGLQVDSILPTNTPWSLILTSRA
jgi:hypothetical protein